MDVSEASRQQWENSLRHPWETVRARIITFLLTNYSQRRIAHILEMGSGDAYILRQLALQNAASHFSAIDTAYTDQLLSQLTIQAPEISFYSSAAQFEQMLNPADVALLPDVLEHVQQDHSLWSAITKNTITSATALIIVTAPAFQMLFSDHDRNLKHFRRYTRKQLVGLCSSANVKVLASGHFFFTLLVARVVFIAIQKVTRKSSKRSIDNWQGGKLTSSIISAILWIDFRIGFLASKFGLSIPGLSCYCVCQKLP